METQIINKITTYGNSVWIVQETQGYNTYNETHPASWSEASSTNTAALILPFSPKTIQGEEYQYYAQGILKEDDYIGFLKATETIEESTDGTTATRYKIEFNNIDYEIIKIFPYEFQDNVIFKKIFIRRITT